MLYIGLMKRVDSKLAKKYMGDYVRVIEKNKGYLEVFSVNKNNELKPFSSPFYYCDRGMLWAANYLTL